MMALRKTTEGIIRCLECHFNRISARKNLYQIRASKHIRCFSISLPKMAGNQKKKAGKEDGYFVDSDNYGKDIEGKFVDWVRLKIKAGDGGNGLAHLKRGKSFMGPDGGDGGNGGDVIIMADRSYRHLKVQKRQFIAANGGKGKVDNCRGKDGQSIIIKVPPGTVVKESCTDNVIADLASHGCSCIVAKGGSGGLGNIHFKSAVNQRTLESTPGTEGGLKTVELEMKSIADVGLVGFPNAGKSTLLRALSRAKPAVAAYPFTTLKPNIGVIEYRDLLQIAVADIPGLVEDAHINKGLGHSFLRHIERCSSLLYVIDISKGDALSNFKILQNEVKLYNPNLLNLPSALVANKMDAAECYEAKISAIRDTITCPVVGVSGKELINVEELTLLIRNIYEYDLKSSHTDNDF